MIKLKKSATLHEVLSVISTRSFGPPCSRLPRTFIVQGSDSRNTEYELVPIGINIEHYRTRDFFIVDVIIKRRSNSESSNNNEERATLSVYKNTDSELVIS